MGDLNIDRIRALVLDIREHEADQYRKLSDISPTLIADIQDGKTSQACCDLWCNADETAKWVYKNLLYAIMTKHGWDRYLEEQLENGVVSSPIAACCFLYQNRSYAGGLIKIVKW
eukprot:CAMPEP_0184650286 /NCGR_PEP_ID=MMETSP0308-20130426/7800_1 /TAXON_ID=38269 /ORGANISM="Gloeochaete witrockiana, Strain SAG 46.84" /LENGTH=114 /DNA_ID=CAMNT_0027083691 /DNA_START=98 /DNA_END=439 /DNA_ORIENTATION=-